MEIASFLLVAAAALGGCSSGQNWEGLYTAELDQQWADTPATEQVEFCRTIEEWSDSDLRAAIVRTNPTDIDESSAFGRAVIAEGIEPTRADFAAAADITLEKTRANCN